MERETPCRNSGAISNVVDARHGISILAPILHSRNPEVVQQGELAASQALIKGTTLDFGFLLPNSPCCTTEPHHINEA